MLLRFSAVLISLVFLPSFAQAAITDANIQSALRSFYTDLKGPTWSESDKRGWVIADPVSGEESFEEIIDCNARGISCDVDNNVTGLSFSSVAEGYGAKVTEQIGQITTLTSLYLPYNKILSVPDSIGNLVNLRGFNLSGNPIGILPETFGNLTKLEYINLERAYRFTTLPESFGNLSSLKEVNFQQTKIASLPVNFGNLSALEKANLGYTLLRTLPESFKKLSSLKRLIIWNTRMTELPSVVTYLRALEYLEISRLGFPDLPENFGNLTMLKNLSANGNNFNRLPDSFEQLTRLEELTIGINRFTEFPLVLLKLTQLKKLYIQGNNMYGAVPADLINLVNLQDYDESLYFKWGLVMYENAMTSDDATLNTFMAQKSGPVDFHDGQVLALEQAAIKGYDRNDNIATITFSWKKPEYAGSEGFGNSFRVQVKSLLEEESEFVDFMWIEEKEDQPISWRLVWPFTNSSINVLSVEYNEGYYTGTFTLATDAENYEMIIAAAHQYSSSSRFSTIGKASPVMLVNDVDEDGVSNELDVFAMNPAVALDSDSDGMPDAFLASCNEMCQQESGLTIDPYPNDATNTPPSPKPVKENSSGGNTHWLFIVLLMALPLLRKSHTNSYSAQATFLSE